MKNNPSFEEEIVLHKNMEQTVYKAKICGPSLLGPEPVISVVQMGLQA